MVALRPGRIVKPAWGLISAVEMISAESTGILTSLRSRRCATAR